MSRPLKPWYRAARDTWYVEIDGRQVPLTKGKGSKAEADRAFHRLMAAEGKLIPGRDDRELTVHLLANLFMVDQTARGLAPLTMEFYARHIGFFVERWGETSAASMRPLHVSTWLRESEWGDSTKAGAVASVKRLFRWAKKEGHLDANPMVDVDRPPMGVRAAAMTRAQADAILAYTKDRAWKDFLVAIWETGCRPGELAEVTGDRFDPEAGTLTVVNKTRRKTREPHRLIHLTPFMVELCTELVARNPPGPIFLNARGTPWTRNAMACRFLRLRTSIGLPKGVTAYSARHGYVTDALEAGVPVATVAALVGHTDATMILRVYSKLTGRHSHLRDAAAMVRPAGGRSPAPPPPGHSDGPEPEPGEA